MLFRRWLRALASRIHRRPGKSVRKPRAAKLLLEALEDRCVPSTFTVIGSGDGPGTLVNTGAATYTDTTLRGAINAVNADSTDTAAQPDTINFQGSSLGSGIINPLTPLPQITNPVILNGILSGGSATNVTLQPLATQPVIGPGLDFEAGSGGSTVEEMMIGGFQGNGVTLASNGNTLVACSIGYNQADGVEITSAASGNMILSNSIGFNAMNGVAIDAGAHNNQVGSTAGPGQNNAIGNNTLDGILITGSGTNGNSIQGNNLLDDGQYGLEIAAGASGNSAVGSVIFTNNNFLTIDSIEGNTDGVVLDSGAANNVVQGYTISANTNEGVLITGSGTNLNKIEQGHIGTDATGAFSTTPDNVNGVVIQGGASQNTIGGNVISGNAQNGVLVSDSGTTKNSILGGNEIGINGTATAALPNQTNGVEIANGASDTVIGQVTIISGFVSASTNTISGNGHDGILITGNGTSGNTVQADYIGVATPAGGGMMALPNQGSGVEIAAGASGNIIGGTGTSQGDIIANNGSSTAQPPTGGVLVDSGTDNAIRGDAIYANIGIGIDLGDSGVPLVNDSAGHTGPNNYEDYPVLTSVVAATGGWMVSGNLPGQGTAPFGLDFFTDGASDLPDQGRTPVGSATVNGTGPFSVLVHTALPVPTSSLVTDTATDANNDTSEFAPALPASMTTLTVSPNPASYGQTITLSATVTDPGSLLSSTDTVAFYDGNSLLGSAPLPSSGQVTFTDASLSVGTHSIQARYSGNSNLLGSDSPIVSVTIQMVQTTTALSASPTPAVANQPVTFSAVVSSNVSGLSVMPTGTVTFQDGGNTLGTGNLQQVSTAQGTVDEATLAEPELAPGPHTITAAYSGDSTFAGSTTSLTLEVDFVVTNTLDSGPGSLGQAILDADNAMSAVAVPIVFAIPAGDSGYNASANTFTINLQTALPTITSPVDIDGTTEASTVAGATVVLNGSAVAPSPLPPPVSSLISFAAVAESGGAAAGLEFDFGSDGSTVLGLTIENFGDPAILMYSSSNSIGGTAAGQGNTIFNNGTSSLVTAPYAAGVVVDGMNGASGDAIRGNAIYNNAMSGISLVNDGNMALASPVLTSAQVAGTNVTVSGTLAAASQSVELDFYANAASAAVEGQLYVGPVQVMTDAQGNFSATLSIPSNWSVANDPVLTATDTDTPGDTSPFSAGLSLSVAKMTPKVKVTDVGGPYTGASFPATATVNGQSGLESVSPTLTYYAGSTVSGTPLSVAPSTAGNYTVVANFAGSADYTSASDQATFTITQATPALRWVTPTAITYGTALSAAQLNASANVPGTFTYAPAAGTKLSAGLHTLSVVFTPTDSTDYTTATATVQLTVQKATPVLNVIDVGGPYTGKPYPATVTVNGAPSLEGVTPTVTYSTVSGTQLSSSPSAPGSYIVVASFAGSADYTSPSGARVAFTISNFSLSNGQLTVFGNNIIITTTQVTADGQTYLLTAAIQSIQANLLSSSGSVNVYSTRAGLPVSVNLNGGTLFVSEQTDNLNSIQGPISVVNPNGPPGTVYVNDSSNSSSVTYALTQSAGSFSLTRPGVAAITSSGPLAGFVLYGGNSGNDIYQVSGTLLAPLTINAGSGSNTLNLPAANTAASLVITQPASTGSGTWTFSGGVPLSFSGMATLNNAGTLASIQTAAFLSHSYQDLLSRGIDFAGLKAWSAQMNAGLSRYQFALDVLSSPEYHQDLVKSWYEQYLGRPADPAGLSAWTNLLNSGWTDEAVENDFLKSQEFWTDSGSTNAGFVNRLYLTVLNRESDTKGFAFWLGELNSGVSRPTVGLDLLTCPEYRTDLVTSYYEKYLRRAPDPTGLTGWIAALNGGATDEQVIAGIVGSQEYYNRLL